MIKFYKIKYNPEACFAARLCVYKFYEEWF